ncbi:MAG: ATP-binding cassette domain-containing protein [Bacteroidetes bacterium]|jgi:iron complex transport system ATP-binding protein|nr:ATP-binding cassette domain-containing protein [Bacteroidota bacterium]
MQKDQTILKLHNITSGYPPDFYIRNINVDVVQGSLTGIIGPNGAGKTTLFRTITGSIHSLEGDMLIQEKKVRDMNQREKARHIAIVTQDIESADIVLEDYVLMGRYPYHRTFQVIETAKDHEIAEKYMRLTDIWDYRKKKLNQLSGGERQLAAIARALTQEPEILLLDEPTSHLDITHQVQLLNLIQRLNEQLSLTVLMIIHDLNLAGEYCDYLIMMNEGTIHKIGTPEDVLTFNDIEDVYKTVVITQTNPLSNRPAIFLVSGKVMEQNKEMFRE